MKSLLNHPDIKMLIHNILILVILSAIITVIFYIKKHRHQSVSSPSIFITIFIFFITFPLFQQQFNIFRYKPLDEKRHRVDTPSGNMFIKLLEKNNSYAQNYEKYYNDNYGFRDNFIRLKNQIDYTFFNVSDEVLIGKNNFLFYKNVIEKEKIYIEQREEKELNDIQNNLLKINSQLKSQGILFVIIPIPMKNTVYPEFYINRTTQIPKITRFSRLINFIDQHPEIKTIPAQKILLEAKKKYPVFHQTDFHWNDVGAHFVSQQTINKIATWTQTPLTWDYPLKIDHRLNMGGQNDALALILPARETAFFVQPIRHRQSTTLETKLPIVYHFISNSKNKKNLLPKTIFVGNSYSLNLLNTGFFDFFSEILVIHSNNIQKLPAILSKDTKIVILQLIEIDLLKNYIFQTDFVTP